MKKIIVLGGGFDQVDLINELKSRGYYILLIDYNENPIAKEYADEHIQVSTLDVDKVLEIARGKGVDNIVTACTDQALLTMAYVADKLNFPCLLTYEQAKNITDKSYMKRKMWENSIPTARYKVVKSFEEDISEFRLPIVVKPVDCNSSKGVTIVRKKDDYKLGLNSAIGQSRSKLAIVEEYLYGKEVSIDAYVTDTDVVILMIGELVKVSLNNDTTRLIIQNVIPAGINCKAYYKIKEIARSISSVFSLKNTPLLIQAMVDEDDVRVIEFSARMGGGCKHHTIKAVTGFDCMKANVDSLLGITPSIPLIDEQNMIISRLHLYLSPGVLVKIKGVKECLETDVCEEIVFNKRIGTIFSAPKASTDRLGSVLFKSASIEELNVKITKLLSTLQIIGASGKNMIYKELYSAYMNY